MSAAAMVLPGDRGAVRREASFVAAIVLTLFWLLPIAILVMNAFKTPQDFLLSTGLTPPHTFALFDNVARAWAKGLSRASSTASFTGSPRRSVRSSSRRSPPMASSA
jgi:multiple sugar transport system permease protein